MTMEDAARKDADKVEDKMEDRKDADLDKFLSKMDAVCARLDAMEASMKDRKDSDEKEAKCDADEDDKSEKKDRKDAKKDGEGDDEAMMTAADKKDADEEKEEAARKDAQIAELNNRLAALEHRTKPVAETDRALFARAQARADGVAQAFGDSAPRQMQGEDLVDYRRRLLSPFQKHSTAWKGVDISALPEDALTRIEDAVYHDAAIAARNPADVPTGHLRAVENTRHGRTTTEFFGRPSAWMSTFSSGRRGLTGINTKHQGA